MPWRGFEPRRLSALPPQDSVSTSFTTRALRRSKIAALRGSEKTYNRLVRAALDRAAVEGDLNIEDPQSGLGIMDGVGAVSIIPDLSPHIDSGPAAAVHECDGHRFTAPAEQIGLSIAGEDGNGAVHVQAAAGRYISRAGGRTGGAGPHIAREKTVAQRTSADQDLHLVSPGVDRGIGS